MGLLLVMDWEHVWQTHSLPLKVTLSPIGKGFLQGNEEESQFLLPEVPVATADWQSLGLGIL